MVAVYPLSLLVLGLVLAIVSIPNWRTGKITNVASLVVLAAGIASCATRIQLSPGGSADELFAGTWLLLAVGLIGSSFAGLPGGIAKLLVAMLPWFRPEDFLVLLTLSGFAHFAMARIVGRTDAPAVPAIAASTLLVAAYLAWSGGPAG